MHNLKKISYAVSCSTEMTRQIQDTNELFTLGIPYNIQQFNHQNSRQTLHHKYGSVGFILNPQFGCGHAAEYGSTLYIDAAHINLHYHGSYKVKSIVIQE